MALDHTQYEESVWNFFNSAPSSSFEEIRCPICKDPDQRLELFHKGFMRLYRCKCDFVYNGYQPTKELLDKFYKQSDAMDQWSNLKLTYLEIERQKIKYERAINFIGDMRIASLVDLGCGTGRFLYLLRNKFPHIKILGIDTNQHALNMASVYEVPTMNASLNTPLSIVNFEAASLWGVLEHAKDPVGLLRNVRDTLVGKRTIIVCVPNVNSLVVRMLRKECFTFCPQHLWYFNHKTLMDIFLKAGFRLDIAYTIESESDPISKANMLCDPYGELPFWARDAFKDALNIEVPQGFGYKIVAIGQAIP